MTCRYDEEPDVDEAGFEHPWLDNPNSPAYWGLCEHCGQRHATGDCPHITPANLRPGRRRIRARSAHVTEQCDARAALVERWDTLEANGLTPHRRHVDVLPDTFIAALHEREAAEEDRVAATQEGAA